MGMINALSLFALAALVSCSRPHNGVIIQNKGSDTLVNLAQAWAEEYKQIQPSVAVAVSGGGSGTGIAALINGTVDIANSSRSMKPEERAEAEKNNGGAVTEHVVGLDALAVFVNPANPLTEMSFEEIACIFGESGTCDKWSDIRGTVVPGCKDNQIIRVSRQSNSGTYQYFREAVVGKTKDLRLGSMDLNGSREGIDMVSKTPCSISYTGMGYLNHEVKSICISKKAGDPCVAPTPETAASKTYPISRELFMYTVGTPKPEVTAFLEWIKTPKAREIIVRAGYVPVK